jgi:hypothetical protein
MGGNTQYNKYIQQKMELLILNPLFQSEIKRAREYLDIPINGFVNEEERDVWLAKKTLDIESKTKQKQRDFENQKISIYELMSKANISIGLESLISKITRDIIKKFISSKSIRREYVISYLLFNHYNENEALKNIRILDNLALIRGVNDTEKSENFIIEIFPDTDLSDIKDILEKNKSEGGNPKRKRPIDKFEMNKRVYELSQQKLVHRKIALVINKEFNKSFSYYDIPKIIARFKQRIMDI